MTEIDELADDAVAHPVLAPPTLAAIEERVRRRKHHRFMRVAAVSTVVLLGAGFGAWLIWSDDDGQPQVVATLGTEAPTLPANTTNSLQDIVVPDVVGLPLGEARTVLSEVDLKPLILDDVNYDDDTAFVGTQAPTAGSTVVPGTTVVLGVVVAPQRGTALEPGAYPIPIGDPACAEPPPNAIDPTNAEVATAVFVGWLNTQPRADGGVFIENWDLIGEAVMAAADDAPLPLDDYGGFVDEVLSTSADLVCVEYTIANDSVVVYRARGAAVLRDGVWKVSTPTVCAAIAVGNIRCPGQDDDEAAPEVWNTADAPTALLNQGSLMEEVAAIGTVLPTQPSALCASIPEEALRLVGPEDGFVIAYRITEAFAVPPGSGQPPIRGLQPMSRPEGGFSSLPTFIADLAPCGIDNRALARDWTWARFTSAEESYLLIGASGRSATAESAAQAVDLANSL